MQHSEFLLAQKPGILSGRGAKQWLRELPLTDARSAHHAVAAMLAEWEDLPAPPEARLEVLETVRGHVAEIDAQYAARYAEKPLPLGLKERNAFNHAQVLWRRMAAAYLQCFEASFDQAPAIAPHRALCLVRAGAYYCDTLMGRFRSGQVQDPELTADLQRLVELAGEHDLTDVVVRDSLHPRGCTNVAATYRRALLIAQIGHAATGRVRQAMFELVHLWEGKSVFATPLPGSQVARQPPEPGEKRRLRALAFGHWRHVVDVTRLSRSLRRRMRKIDVGLPFEDLHLPESFRSLPVREVLARLDALWCTPVEARSAERDMPRNFAGEPAPQRVGVAYAGDGFDAMYFMVAGEAFASGGEEDPASRRRFDDLFVFQGASHARQELRAKEVARNFEDWEILDESHGGFRLRRPRAGARFRSGQLLAMRLRLSGDDGPVVLAQVKRLCEPEGGAPGSVEAGVELVPGKPHGIGVRACGVNAVPGTPMCSGFRQGSLFAHETVSLVLPCGWFRAERVVEIRDGGRTLRVRLTALRERGTDFEHIEAVRVS